MKILFITRSFDHAIGGMETHTYRLIEHLIKCGDKVTVLTPYLNTAKGYAIPRGVKVVRISKLPNPLIKYDFTYWRAVKRYLQKQAQYYDRIVNVSMSIGYPFGWPDELKAKTISILHSTYVLERKTLLRSLKGAPFNLRLLLGVPYTFIFDRILKSVIMRSKRVIVVAEGVRNSLINHYNLNVDNVYVVKNYVDMDVFRWVKRNFKDAHKLIYVSRVHQQKGILFLLDTIQQITLKQSKKLANITLDVVGDGPALIEAKNYVSRHNLGNVRFYGKLGSLDIAKRLQKNQLFIFPTLCSEGLPIALLEAMSTGLPCIGSDVEGVNEIISNGHNGYLFKVGDAPSLISTLERAMNNNSLDTISRNARESVVSSHDSKVQISKLRDCIIA